MVDYVLIPFSADEAITIRIASRIAGRPERTMQAWAAEKGIGRRIGGQWRISRVALQMLLDGDGNALRAYRAGDRSSERVLGYFRRAGLKRPPSVSGVQEP